jgi:hypothetical protein
MANLKDTNVDELFAQLAEVEERGIKNLRETACGLIDELKTVIATHGSLPHRASDLVAEAAIAQVLDVDWTQPSWGHSRHLNYVEVSDTTGHHTTIRLDKQVPIGKYRLLFFVLPIKE